MGYIGVITHLLTIYYLPGTSKYMGKSEPLKIDYGFPFVPCWWFGVSPYFLKRVVSGDSGKPWTTNRYTTPVFFFQK